MATAACSLFSLSLPSPTLRLSSLSVRAVSPRARLSASVSLSCFAFPLGGFGAVTVGMTARRRRLAVVCEVAPTGRQPDSVKKRERQNERRRIRNKARKAEMRTRMKKDQLANMRKVFKALEKLRKKADAQPEDILPIEKMIAEAYSAIDKTVKVGAMHKNTGGHRKSRLARRKRAIEIIRGWYVPSAEPAVAA